MKHIITIILLLLPLKLSAEVIDAEGTWIDPDIPDSHYIIHKIDDTNKYVITDFSANELIIDQEQIKDKNEIVVIFKPGNEGQAIVISRHRKNGLIKRELVKVNEKPY